uniref:uncharacterized protein LOC120328933 n=1 Tax=Styela clava TaxID=7725 RepID=UPI001939E740|nr:uncharacterized protein LOC120328933 [Styela clava]
MMKVPGYTSWNSRSKRAYKSTSRSPEKLSSCITKNSVNSKFIRQYPSLRRVDGESITILLRKHSPYEREERDLAAVYRAATRTDSPMFKILNVCAPLYKWGGVYKPTKGCSTICKKEGIWWEQHCQTMTGKVVSNSYCRSPQPRQYRTCVKSKCRQYM